MQNNENHPATSPIQAIDLTGHENLFVQQIREVAEWFGFETRNKYQILDANKNPVAYAAEQQKGFLGFLLRQFLGHWRVYSIHFFNPKREVVMVAHHPFRFYFQRLEIKDHSGRAIGALQKRFSILTKRFDVENANGQFLMEVSSPIWKFWTFPFYVGDKAVAHVRKKWSGVFSEVFTDRDNFHVEYNSQELNDTQKKLILAAALFIDLQYFENKAGKWV